jgi:hypothetical protein
MHHEDRAGVDAFLAGIDSLASAKIPVIVVLCTNRVGALDPAVMRRAAATFTFIRPDAQQRHAVLAQALDGLAIGPRPSTNWSCSPGPSTGRPGYTFSDLTQRLVPAAVLYAFPNRPVCDDALLALAEQLEPSPVVTEEH